MPRANRKFDILNTAKALFSVKGFDATGVEELASQTGVPKSLIYYHFKNKDELLNTIINDFFNEYESILQDNSDIGIDKIARYISFLESNKDCIRIILAESLKQNQNSTLLFKVLQPLMKSSKDNLQSKESNNYEEMVTSNHSHWVAEFFTSILPTIMLVCYEDNWCNFFNAKKEDLLNDYQTAYTLTHGAYHKHIGTESL